MTRPGDREGEELARALQEPAPVPEVEAQLGAGHPALEQVASLQRTAGNQAVARMLEQSRRRPPGLGDLPRRGSMIARDIAPGAHAGALGTMDIKMLAKNEAATGGRTGLKGSVTFTPDPKSPYSSKIGLVQIVKFTDAKGADQNSASMPAASTPHLRTTEDKAGGVEGGYLTDVLHADFGTGRPTVPAPKGQAHTPYYEGASPEFGFRRAEDAQNIKAAKIEDFPSTSAKGNDINFAFETVAKGDDNQVVYGAVKWAFNIRKDQVVDETHSFTDGASATFDAALERHRDFYVHEPVTLYFDFDADAPSAGEDAKLARLLPYLTRFPDVRVRAEGFADLRGSASHNLGLARRRAQATLDALEALGIDVSRLDPPVATGITTSFADNAVTPQADEANRRANRRVMLTFTHAPAAAPAAPAPAPGP